MPGLTNRPKTTESIAQYIFEQVARRLPIHRIRLHERDDFFAEYFQGASNISFSACSCLSARLIDCMPLAFPLRENLSLYGKCNNPRGHGHRYLTEATIGGTYDERSGTLYDFATLQRE